MLNFKKNAKKDEKKYAVIVACAVDVWKRI